MDDRTARSGASETYRSTTLGVHVCAAHHAGAIGHTSCTPARWNSRTRSRRRDVHDDQFRSRVVVNRGSCRLCAPRELCRSRISSSGGLMRMAPPRRAWVRFAFTGAIALNVATQVSSASAQEVERYPQTLQFGAGYINVPAAWVSRRSADSWLTLSAKDLPSFGDPSKNSLASRLNSNL